MAPRIDLEAARRLEAQANGSPYRGSEPRDIEYETPAKPWHKSTAWFLAAAGLNVVAFAAGDLAAWLDHHPIVAWNATIIALATGIGTIITGIVAIVKRWG